VGFQEAVISLSEEQKQVVDCWGEGLCVLAGAGSGKTTTLVAKCISLLEKKSDARWVAVSFTEKSARDLKEKFSKLCDTKHLFQNTMTTIHGLCASILRLHYPGGIGTVLSESESQWFWDQAIESLWFGDLKEDIEKSLECLFNRETKNTLEDLLQRVRALQPFGIINVLSSLSEESIALAKVSDFLLKYYSLLKKKEGVLDFNDLEIFADEVLENTCVQNYYHKKLDLILIDEFQDTNPLQAKILWKLARKDRSNLCVVGDPKQSIYRFRDADVSVFEEYCLSLPVRKSLTCNYRSVPKILYFVNKLCEPLFIASQMPFEPLVAVRDDESETGVFKLKVRQPEDLARWIQAQPKDSLDKMALLCRRIRGNEKWIQAMIAAKIPFIMGSGGFFWEDPRIQELVCFLKWWENPQNTLSGATFLRAPWMRISDACLDQWVHEDRTFQRPFFASEHPIAKSLMPLKEKILRPGQILEHLLLQEIEGLSVSLLGLWCRAEALSSSGWNFHEVISFFGKCLEEKRKERDVPPADSTGKLKILTLHGSKGLEFSQVILLDFEDKVFRETAPLLFWDRKQGAYLGKREKNGSRSRKDGAEIRWREMEKRKNLEESKRLFYVALTRAKDQLILVCPEERSQIEGVSCFQEDCWGSWIETQKEGFEILKSPEKISFSSIEEKPKKVSIQKSSFQPRLVRSRHSVSEWSLLSRCPKSYAWHLLSPEVIQEASSSDFLDQEVVEADRTLGMQVHAYLETLDFKKLETEHLGSQNFQASKIFEWASSCEWMQPADFSTKIWKELAFEVSVYGEILIGKIDRVFAKKQGDSFFYSLLDFKITRKPKTLWMIRQVYQTQMELYALALSILQPEFSGMEALIVNITPEQVKTFPISLGKIDIYQLAQKAKAIIAGEKAEARPSFECRYCTFLKKCEEGMAFIVSKQVDLDS